MTMSNAPQFLIRERRQLRQRGIVPAEILCTRKLFRKNLDSDDHFDCPFLFMAMKGKLQQQLEHKNMETPSVTKPIHCSPLRRALLLIALTLATGLFSTSARAGSGSYSVNDVSGNYVWH